MSLRINHNIAALNANRNLKQTTDMLTQLNAEAVDRISHQRGLR